MCTSGVLSIIQCFSFFLTFFSSHFSVRKRQQHNKTIIVILLLLLLLLLAIQPIQNSSFAATILQSIYVTISYTNQFWMECYARSIRLCCVSLTVHSVMLWQLLIASVYMCWKNSIKFFIFQILFSVSVQLCIHWIWTRNVYSLLNRNALLSQNSIELDYVINFQK